jgi:hypothetical protein
VWNVLSDGKFELLVANARHIKNADLDLIVYSRCDTAAGMNGLARIVRNSTMIRFGWAMEDVVR